MSLGYCCPVLEKNWHFLDEVNCYSRYKAHTFMLDALLRTACSCVSFLPVFFGNSGAGASSDGSR